MELINARLYTCEGKIIPNGFLRTTGEKIASLGAMEDYMPDGGETIDCTGRTVFPGFIDAHCHIGMWEDSLGFEGDDGNESTNPVTASLRAIDAVNPMDRCFTEAVAGGVTTVLTGPGSANPIGGMWSALKTCGSWVDNMAFVPEIGMKFALGENPKTVYNSKNQTPCTRMATASIIRETLYKAQRYGQELEKARTDKTASKPEFNMGYEALLPVLNREKKAFFHCHRADDILTALRITKEFSLDTVFVHCTEGYLITSILKQEHAKIITGPIITDRSKPELRNQTPANAGILSKAGLTPAVCTDHPVIPIQYLPLSAGICVKEGLDYDEAILALTRYPAEICGIADRVGSLKEGKDADLCVYSDDPLSVYAKPELVMIDGVCRYRK